jgi:hypothetical protein
MKPSNPERYAASSERFSINLHSTCPTHEPSVTCGWVMKQLAELMLLPITSDNCLFSLMYNCVTKEFILH